MWFDFDFDSILIWLADECFEQRNIFPTFKTLNKHINFNTK